MREMFSLWHRQLRRTIQVLPTGVEPMTWLLGHWAKGDSWELRALNYVHVTNMKIMTDVMVHFSSELPMSLTKIDCEQSLFCSKICESVCEMMQVCKVCEFFGPHGWIDSSCLFSIAQAPTQLVTHNFAAPTPGTLALLHMRSCWFLILGSNLFSFVSVYNNAQYWVSSIKQGEVNILIQW